MTANTYATEDLVDALTAADVGADPAGTAASAVAAEAALARNADNLTGGTVADARVASTIARDSEVTAAVAAEATLARNADNLTSGTVADARIASTLARDSEVTAAVDAEATLARNADNLTSGTVADARIASTIARDSEVAALVAPLNTQAAIQAARQAALLAANAGYYIGAGLDYTPSSTAGKMDRTSGIALFDAVEGTGGTAATAIGSDVATLGAALTAGQEMWVTFEVGSTGTTFQNAGSAAAEGSAAIPDTTAGRDVVGWMYIEYASVALNAVDELLTTANDKAKWIDARVVRPGPSTAGWCYDQDTWTTLAPLTSVSRTTGNNTFDKTSHGLVAGDCITFTGLATTTGVLNGVTYFVSATGLTANAFRVAASNGGAAIALGGTTDSSITVTLSSFKIAGVDRTARFATGTRVRCTNNGVTYYGTVIATTFATDTIVALAPNPDYTFAAATITFPAYSSAPTPSGYPFWFTWAPVYGGFSADPSAAGNVKFSIVGNVCTILDGALNGTSNALTFTMTAPVPCSTSSFSVVRVVDNGSPKTTPGMLVISALTSTITMRSDTGTGAWTNTAAKGAAFLTAYPI